MDIKTAFLNGPLKEKIYQVLRAWYDELSTFLMTKGFTKDVDHVGCLDTRKSTSEGIQFLGEKLVSWMSKKQGCTAMSTTEVEYLAAMFTKAQSQDRFEYLVRRLDMRCLTPAELEVMANEYA
ncbi:hypothetical protein Tco_1363928 [Tanacetum coccineum]